MTTVHRTALVPYTSEQMFNLVNDIEQYPLFLPWCPKVLVLNETPQEIEATLYIAKGVWTQAFTTVNQLIPHERVEMRLREGPFKHLEGIWQFQTMSEGSQVSLDLSFEFDSKLLALTVGPVFQHLVGTLVQAFTQRAHHVYASG